MTDFLLVLALWGGLEMQVPPVKNPVALIFTSVDHATITGYEIDFIRITDNSVVQTLIVPKASTIVLPTNEIQVNLNVQPVAFGDYRFIARCVFNAIIGINSPSSDSWQRVPGAPSKPLVK